MSRKHRFERRTVIASLILVFVLTGCVEDSAPTDPTRVDADVLLDVQTEEGQLGYEVVILAPEWERSGTNAINKYGAVVGSTQPEGVPGPTYPYLWRDGELIRGDQPAFTAADINDSERVAGSISSTGSAGPGEEGPGEEAAVWDGVAAGFANYQVLPTPEHTVQSRATAVNGPGAIVGAVRVVITETDTIWKHVLWHDLASLPPTTLEPLGGFDITRTTRISDAGYVTGVNRRLEDGRPVEYSAVVWRVNDGDEEVQPVSLPHLSSQFSGAHGINKEGDVVGEGGRVPGSLQPVQAVLWRYEGNGQWRHPINLAPSDRHGREAVGITSRGGDGTLRIAGTAGSNQGRRAVVWTVDDLDNVEMQVLPFPPHFHPNRSTAGARAISDDGWIAGWVQDHGGEYPIAVLWKPVSESADPAPPPSDDDLVASFTYDCGNTATCHFTDTSTGSPTGWSWSMPDGDPDAASGSATASTTYPSAGTYAVTLTVSRGDEKDDATRTITCRQQGPNLRCR